MQHLATTSQTNNYSCDIDNLSWPKDFHELKLMDDAFKCGICYDYIRTSMLTPCGHSYCSICIRKSLLYKSACPICFEETFETSLRNNRVLDRLTELFAKIRKNLIKHLKIAAVHFNCNEKQLEQSKTSGHSTPKNPTITAVPDATPTRGTGTQKSISTAKGKLSFSPNVGVSTNFDISKQLEEILSSPSSSKPVSSTNTLDCSVLGNTRTNQNESRIPTVPSMFLQPKPESLPKGLAISTVPCPVCNVNIPERNINTHLDNCLANVDQPPVSQVKSKHKRKPLAKMVWSLMPEKDLRKKLKEHSLNTQGDKKALITRIQKFITLYNSECDSDSPRPISEIIRIVEKEEKIGQSNQSQQRLLMSKMDPKVIEESNTKYIQENKESFMKLIKEMEQREGKYIKPVSRLLNRISDDTSDTEDNNLKERDNSEGSSSISFPSTSKVIVDHIDLCDSNGPTSPVLDASFNGFDDAEDYEYATFEPQVVVEEDSKSDHSKEDGLAEEALLFTSSPLRSFTDSPEMFQKSPRSVSPSCIEPPSQPNESEDSISLLINHKIDNGVVPDEITLQSTETEGATANNKIISQVNDPDFVIDTEELLNDNVSEEVFVPQRKSKRKLYKSSLSVAVQNDEPRRTRRRINK